MIYERMEGRAVPQDLLRDLVEHLAQKYPDCFFVEGAQKLPLKKDIHLDLRDAGESNPNLMDALSYYTNDWAYLQYAMQAGNLRVGLEGETAIKVTEAEQREALDLLKEKQAASRAKREAEQTRTVLHLPQPPRPKLSPEMAASFEKIEQRINKARILLADDPELGPQLAATVLSSAAKLAEDLARSLSA